MRWRAELCVFGSWQLYSDCPSDQTQHISEPFHRSGHGQSRTPDLRRELHERRGLGLLRRSLTLDRLGLTSQRRDQRGLVACRFLCLLPAARRGGSVQPLERRDGLRSRPRAAGFDST